MTTILADAKLGVMVADSSISNDDRVWSGKKVWRVRDALVGMAGQDNDRIAFLDWYRAGMNGPVAIGEASALILTPRGLFFMDANYAAPQRVEHGREAVGTGDKAAMCAYEALGWQDPARAVRIVCKHDSASRSPVRTYHLTRKPA
jgi:hypothetical protein